MADLLSNLFSSSTNKQSLTPQTWNIMRGVFTQKDDPTKSVVFFTEVRDQKEDRTKQTALDEVSDGGGQRLAVYEYPYVDGQKIRNMGRRGETHTFNIKFFGSNYQSLFDSFMRVANAGKAGTLTHPTLSPLRGSLTVQLRDYEIMHRHDEWNAVTIRAVFVEDSTDVLSQLPEIKSVDSTLKNSVQNLTDQQSNILKYIDQASQGLALPSNLISQLKGRITAIANLKAKLLGSLASTFNLKNAFTGLFSDASGLAGGLFSLSGGSVAQASSTLVVGATLPPSFQVGYDPVTLAKVTANQNSFISSNQITPQQAVYQANTVRQNITAAINEINQTFGNAGSDIVLSYRSLAISTQEAVEAAIATNQTKVKMYTLPRTMSLRTVAYENGLSPDRQNDIEQLNPYLPSINFIPKGSIVSVPVQ